MNKAIENALKEVRLNRGHKQTKVSMDLGTTQEIISSYETGRIFPSYPMLIDLAKYYNTSIDYLLCRTKYDMPIDTIKSNNISDKNFILLNKINKLSSPDKAEVYIDGLNDK